MSAVMEQRSPEWFATRLGKLTASRMADARAKTRSGWGASRKNYMAELVAERLTGVQGERFFNSAMQWGIDKESEARSAYEFLCGESVVEVGFLDHPDIEMSGASPDGFVGDVGMVEIKCPNTATHIDTLLGNPIPDKYVQQMQWQMACAGRKWCDFVSYDPRLPMSMQLNVERVERDDDLIAEMEKDVREFLGELDAMVSELRSKYE